MSSNVLQYISAVDFGGKGVKVCFAPSVDGVILSVTKQHYTLWNFDIETRAFRSVITDTLQVDDVIEIHSVTSHILSNGSIAFFIGTHCQKDAGRQEGGMYTIMCVLVLNKENDSLSAYLLYFHVWDFQRYSFRTV